MHNNIILQTDSYKVSHHKMYPPDTQYVYSYLEARGPTEQHGFPEVVFFGLQYYLKEYLEGQVVTKEKIDEAEEIFREHFGSDKIFNRAGWEYILEKHDGKLPVTIKAVPEGACIPRGQVLMTVENTDPQCYWLTNYLESLLVQVWYGTTIATQSREYKILLLDFMEKTSDDSTFIDFKLHDFGLRGSTSVESAGVGGCAHLISFKGTDTLPGIQVARRYYACPMAGYSIPASEHSTITAWGKDKELDAFTNILQQFPDGLVACVSDSYNIYQACSNYWGKMLKSQILQREGCLVVRPDSGEPRVSVIRTLNMLGEEFGYTTNKSRCKVLPPQIRVIQGDGIDFNSIKDIIHDMQRDQWSADNIAFGSGGGLLQKVNRDTCRFAFKCSSVNVGGSQRDVWKEPYDDSRKTSKRGKFKLIYEDNKFKTVRQLNPGNDLLVEVFRDGRILREWTLDEIRDLAFVD